MDELEILKKKNAAYKTAIKKINDCVNGEHDEAVAERWFDGVHDALTELEEDLEILGDQDHEEDEES